MNQEFCSKFGPPPQPKLLKIELPEHAVPDVSYQFSSTDSSFIWKAGSLKKKGPSLQFDKVVASNPFPKDLLNENSRPVSPSNAGAFSEHYSFQREISKNTESIVQDDFFCQTTKNVDYDPEVYKSPASYLKKDVILANYIDLNKGPSSLKFGNDSKFKEHKDLINKIPLEENQGNIDKCVNSNLESLLKYHCYNKNSFIDCNIQHDINRDNSKGNINISKGQITDYTPLNEFLESSNKSSTDNQRQLINHFIEGTFQKRKIDKDVIKVLEEQKRQISNLQNIVEKILVNQSMGHDSCKKTSDMDNQICINCCQTNVRSLNSKVAIVQTSFSEHRPLTNTIGTNTDLTMHDMTLFFDQRHKFQNPRSPQMIKPKFNTKYSEKRIIKPLGFNKEKYTQVQQGNCIIPLQSRHLAKNKNEDSTSSLKFYNVNDLCDDLQNSLPFNHIDVPPNEVNSENLEEENDEFLGNAYFNQNRDSYCEAEDFQPEDNGMTPTIYNKILINIQQMIQQDKKSDEPNEVDNDLEFIEDPSVKQIEQQLQHYNLSFLDPVTLQAKRELCQNPRNLPMLAMYQGHVDAAIGHNYQRSIIPPPRDHDVAVIEARHLQKNILMTRNQHNYFQEEFSNYHSHTATLRY